MGKLAGVSSQSWQDYEAGVATPKVTVYEALSRAGVNPAWLLLLVNEPMMLVDVREAVVPTAHSDETPIALPRYNVQAAAGDGAVVVSERISEWVYFRREWLRRELGINPRDLVMIVAAGNSMAPTITDGDFLIVDVSKKRWTQDGIYVIGVDDDLWVKRADRRSDGALILSSDNPQHARAAETIAKALISTVRFIGRVVWVGGRV